MQAAVLHLTIESATGLVVAELSLGDLPSEAEVWVEEPPLGPGDATLHVGQDHQGRIRFRVVPPGRPPIRFRAIKRVRPQDPQPPDPE